jgi:HSP20 family protein
MTRSALLYRTPFDEMRRMMAQLDRGWPRDAGALDELPVENLALDVLERDGDLVVRAALPGVAPDEVDIKIADDVLTIKAERKSSNEAQDERYYLRELRYGVVGRSVRLPADIDADQAEARFEHGALTLRLPRKAEAKPRTIKVNAA